MPIKARELGPLDVKRLVKPGAFAVGGVAGLQLQVKTSGARSWLLRMVIAGRRREIGLGGFPDVTLAQARERAREIRGRVYAGIDPIEERRAAKAELAAAKVASVTFDECVRRWHNVKRHEYRSEKHAAQVLTTLTTYASAAIGSTPVALVSLTHVMTVLEPIWTTKTETATRLRGRIENVLSWATVSGLRSGDNPARWKGNLDALLPKPGKISKVSHHNALAIDDVRPFMTALQKEDGMGARALEFAILTAARSGEVRHAVWSEIDFSNAIWTVPAERMKARKEHRVPLSDEAIKLLGQMPRFQGSDFVFSAARGGALSDMTLSAVLRRMKVNAVPHGFRSTFRDWASERTSYPGNVAEMALAHAIGNKVEAAYRRGDLFDRRREMMADWASFCSNC